MRRMLNWALNIAMIFSFSTVLARQGGGGPHANLTDEQKQCMESILGKPDEGERPSREDHEAAMKQCNINRPSPKHENLTAEQKECLDGKLGKPGEGRRPSHEEFETAHKECGVSVPDLPAEQE